MSASSYKPITTLTPASIAVPPAPAMTNQPRVADVKIYNRDPGAVSSANQGAGGYVDPKRFAKG
jgi:hypothetical protein